MRGDMMASTMVQSRIKVELKEQAEAILAATGLTTSEAIRVFLQQVVNVGGLPFTPTAKRPNAKTQAALDELDNRKGKRFATKAELLADLEAD
jgi:DNA-damage-inducible protein J